MESLRYHSFREFCLEDCRVVTFYARVHVFILVLVPVASRLLFCDVRGCSSSRCVVSLIIVIFFQKEQIMVHSYLVKDKAYREHCLDDNAVILDLRFLDYSRLWHLVAGIATKLIQDYGTWLPTIMLEQC